MTEETIKIDVPGAQGTYGPAAADLAANRGAVGPEGVRPGFGTALSGLSSTSNANLDSAAALNGQGSQFANCFDAADKDGAAKAGAAGPKGPGDPSNPAGGPKAPGADKFASRLTPSDLLKMASQPYQSAMPAVQSLPQMAQSIPSMLNAPLQAAQAPIQSMLSGPGGSSILDGLLSRGNAGNGFDGGPPSLNLGSRPSGAADARLYDVPDRCWECRTRGAAATAHRQGRRRAFPMVAGPPTGPAITTRSAWTAQDYRDMSCTRRSVSTSVGPLRPSTPPARQ